MNKEYLTVNEVSKMVQLTPQQVRRRIKTINTISSLLYKDNGEYKIHHLLLPQFRRKKQLKVFAYTQDFKGYSDKNIMVVMDDLINRLDANDVTIQYTIEKKKKDQTPHIHAIVEGVGSSHFIKIIRLMFGNISYKVDAIFNRLGWLEYIVKENNKIITITKNK